MKLRRYLYYFMSVNFLKRRVELNSKRLSNAKSSKERIKILDENFDVIHALIFKQRYNNEFLQMVRTDMQNLINEVKIESK